MHDRVMDYSLNDPLVLDVATRRAQAEKILQVIEHFAREHGIQIDGARCLDIGCSAGIITRALAQRFAPVIGVDVDWSALTLTHQSGVEALADLLSAEASTPDGAIASAQSFDSAPLRSGWRLAMTTPSDAAQFAVGSALTLPFAAESFDVAVCNQVYQYVPDVPRLFTEIHRVLRHGGSCYFSARNLWGVAARENRKPFVASLCSPLVRDQQWRHRAGTLRPYHQLRAVARRAFIVHDYTTRVLSDTNLSDLFVPAPYRAWLAHTPRVLLAAIKPILPTHIWVLQKP